MALLLSKIWVSFFLQLYWCVQDTHQFEDMHIGLIVFSILSLFQGFAWLRLISLEENGTKNMRGGVFCNIPTFHRPIDLWHTTILVMSDRGYVWPWNRQRSTHLLMHLRPPHDNNLHSRLCSSLQIELCNLKTDDLWGWILQITIFRQQKPSILLQNLMYCSSNRWSLFSLIRGQSK